MTAIWIGTVDTGTRTALTKLLDGSTVDIKVIPSVDAAIMRLRAQGTEPPTCVFLAQPSRIAGQFIALLRQTAHLFNVPVIQVVDRITDESYREAHALGADDVVAMESADEIAARVIALSSFDPSGRPETTSGVAVVVHPNRQRRGVLGRVLRQAGFETRFAESAGEAITIADVRPCLIVVRRESPVERPSELVTRLRTGFNSPEIPVVVLGANLTCTVEGNMGQIDEEAPVDSLLFVVNELTRPHHAKRASARVLLSTVCAFRAAGARAANFGLTYNVSEDGMYVRTLNPPNVGDELWIELCPQGFAPMHLRGRVMWVRRAQNGAGLSPPGFGVALELVASPARDASTYRALYADACRRANRAMERPAVRHLSLPFHPASAGHSVQPVAPR